MSRNLFNTRTQQLEEVEFTVDLNNEIVATFEDGEIIKFPAGLTKNEFETLIVQHEQANVGQEIITPEDEELTEAERQNSLDLIEDSTSEEDKNHVPQANSDE